MARFLLENHDHLLVNDTPLDLPALKKVLIQHKIRVFVDATHPYAVNVSENAMTACRELQIPFIRYERQESELPDYNRLFLVKNYEEAAEKSGCAWPEYISYHGQPQPVGPQTSKSPQ